MFWLRLFGFKDRRYERCGEVLACTVDELIRRECDTCIAQSKFWLIEQEVKIDLMIRVADKLMIEQAD